jgi:outer membrane cobalamin receptor
MKKIQSAVVLTLAALSIAASVRGADEAKDADVLVTAARDQRSIRTVAANMQVVTSEDML